LTVTSLPSTPTNVRALIRDYGPAEQRGEIKGLERQLAVEKRAKGYCIEACKNAVIQHEKELAAQHTNHANAITQLQATYSAELEDLAKEKSTVEKKLSEEQNKTHQMQLNETKHTARLFTGCKTRMRS
jgi:hypothetical protein